MTVPAAQHSQVNDPGRVWAPVVDQHATWIAVNPIQGCPKRCTYCFLNERGQTAVPPTQLASAREAVDLLLNSEFYGPSRPVALYTWTDVMALPASRTHLAALLEEWVRRAVPNPVVLITKCRIPDETIAVINSARERGTTVLVYLSYSGLSREVERGIRHDAIVANFPRLAEAGIPIVHYWRPAFPDSAELETMCRVLDYAARYAACTVAAGLKVEPAALDRLAESWPELARTPGVTEAAGVYPRPFWEFIHRTWQRHPGYRCFTPTPAPCPMSSTERTRSAFSAARPAGSATPARSRSANAAPPPTPAARRPATMRYVPRWLAVACRKHRFRWSSKAVSWSSTRRRGRTLPLR